jgi:hypothetical protein
LFEYLNLAAFGTHWKLLIANSFVRGKVPEIQSQGDRRVGARLGLNHLLVKESWFTYHFWKPKKMSKGLTKGRRNEQGKGRKFGARKKTNFGKD